MTIGGKLRELRKRQGMSPENVCKALADRGQNVAPKTLYGYENGNRMPNADLFLVLCEIYECTNILETFADIKANYSIPSDSEWKLIEKIRGLDRFGLELVGTVVDHESRRYERQRLHASLDAELDSQEEARTRSSRSTDGSSPIQDTG